MARLVKSCDYVYVEMERDLERQITGGQLKPGDCILSENMLSQRYRISRMSARKGVEHLVARGLLYRVPGKGTFVGDIGALGEGRNQVQRVVSFIVPDIEDVFIADVYQGVRDACRATGETVIVQSSDRSIEKENANLAFLLNHRIQGALIFPNWGRANVEAIVRLKQRGFPFVLIDRFFTDIDTDYVGVENRGGAMVAVAHLVQLGHRRIAHIRGTEGSSNYERWEGYRDALAGAGITYDGALVRAINAGSAENSMRFEPDDIGGFEEMRSLLALPQRPTAVFAGNDYLAIGAMRAIKAAGLVVPRDVAVIGFDDLRISAVLEIPLTTVRQPKYEIGRSAAEILIRKLRTGSHAPASGYRRIVLSTRLVVRSSCGGAAV